ncbi:hypothetical protein BD410DRAFT_787656 [Rickenella mellea]|uniref:Acyl-CoA dehydrogenase NM domain-like protein n=1 Tax=Rickenella mellea TaxID=50990 RepID=A0A4Y7Q6P0_9AGAM|nr:hypothetical protein BD410DRAFT_787656 [Rickenella mellea]
MRIEEGFQLTQIPEPNPYPSDLVLPSLLRRLLPASYCKTIDADLFRFGERITNEIRQVSELAEPPSLTQYNHWGQRIDELRTSEGWRKLKAIAQAEGLVGIFYEREFQEYSRLYGFAKVMLMVGDGQVVFCPLSMTDGCARILEVMGTPEMKREIYPRLISRNPDDAFTSGQWMTERTGGSDVSQTETIATPCSSSTAHGSEFKLDGFKWFSSATDSDVAVALARTGPAKDGSRSLSLFLVPLCLPLLRPAGTPRPSSTSNGILVHRLKKKIGTHIVPTAELSLNNTEAYLVSKLNEGVKSITPVLNITRIHSAIGSVGSLRRALSLAREYATVRTVQGGTVHLSNVPLHVAELAKISIIYRALAHLVFGAVHLLGKTECGVATSDEERRLRLLTPVAKAFSAEKACTAMEECMAALGGQGYMEETGIGRLIRDCLVEKIWEGTITVLSLDLVRATRDRTTVEAYAKWANAILSSCPTTLHQDISLALATLRTVLTEIIGVFSQPDALPPLVPRPALMLFSHVTASLYLLEHAIWSHKGNESEHKTDAEVFIRWVEENGMKAAGDDVRRMMESGVQRQNDDMAIVYGSAGGKAKL